MKLIRQLERKLSWRSNKKKQQQSQQQQHSKLQQQAQNGEKYRRSSKFAINSGTIKVSDSEFSQYIRFTTPIFRSTDMATESSDNGSSNRTPISYEIVSIRTRSPLQPLRLNASNVVPTPPRLFARSSSITPKRISPLTTATTPSSCDYRSSSPRREETTLDMMHVYDQIDANNIGNVTSADHRYSNTGGGRATSVTIACRRNRIKTNPWFSSPWTNRKHSISSDASAVIGDSNISNSSGRSSRSSNSSSNSNDRTLSPLFGANMTPQNDENMYESIENILDSRGKRDHLLANTTISRAHSVNPDHRKSSPSTQRDHHHTNRFPAQLALNQTYLKCRAHAVPNHHQDEYPKSSLPSSVVDADHFVTVAPSPEFISQSHRICSEISNYFTNSSGSPNNDRRSNNNDNNRLNADKFDSMETIDLTPDDLSPDHPAMSVWSLHDNDDDDVIQPISSPNDTEPNFDRISRDDSTQLLPKIDATSSSNKNQYNTYNKTPITSKRKRPDSIYSTRQSKKVDKLKFKLKEVVHAAILEAKKEDMTKA